MITPLLNNCIFFRIAETVFSKANLYSVPSFFDNSSVLYNVNNMNKLLLTPHIAWASIESRQRCVDEVYKNILAFLKNEKRNSLV